MQTSSSKSPPTPLILYDSNTHSYALTPESQKLLSSIPSNHLLCTITILGPYRTGKSLLLNRVLLNKTQGFPVGNTVNACTKGLWLYSISGKEFLKALPPGETSAVTEDSTVLIIDTEGFGSVNASQTHDNRVFLMALLLSSLVIYNSVGTIDEAALSQLALITSLSNELQSKLDAPIGMPYFLWVLRDFMLKLEDKTGNKINSKDYLEQSLEIQKGLSEAIEKKNKVRRMFNHYFPERDCVTLMRPLEDEEQLRKLNELDDTLLRNEFLEQLSFLKLKVLKKTCPKTLLTDSKNKQSKPIIGGNMFMNLCQSFLEVINEGKIAKIDNIWRLASTNEANKILNKTVESFERLKDKFLLEKNIKEIDKTLFCEFQKNIRKELLATYIEKVKHLEIASPENLLKNLLERINDKIDAFRKENQKAWNKRYEAFMEKELQGFEDRAMEYDSYFDFREEMQRFEEKFKKEVCSGPHHKRFFLKISLRLWVKYVENFTRKQRSDHRKFDSQKHQETLELLRFVKEKKSMEKDTSAAEKQEFSKLFELLQAQLNESKQVQDQILFSLKDQKEKTELIQQMSPLKQSEIEPKVITNPVIDEQMIETNKHLSMALQKLEDLHKKQEEKIKKYKNLKKFIKYGAYIECSVCHGLFKPLEFLPHAGTCQVAKRPIIDSPPEIDIKYEYKPKNYYKDDQSFSTTLNNTSLNNPLHHISSPSLFGLKNTLPAKRETASYMPHYDYEQSYLPKTYASHLGDNLLDTVEKIERKTKSFLLNEDKNEDFDDYSDNNEYNMPRPLNNNAAGQRKHGEIKAFHKEESEILLSHEEMHHKDLNLPFMKQSAGANYWEKSFQKDKGTAEGKLSEFNTTLFPDGEIKTMAYVKKKSKGSSKGSNGHDSDEQQGIKGLMKQAGNNQDLWDRRKSWNVVIKDETKY